MTSPTDIESISPDVKVNGSTVPDPWYDAMVSMRIEREVNLVGRCVLRFVDSGYKLSAASIFTLGAQVTVTSSSATLMDGIVTGASLEQIEGHLPELIVTVDDKACRLAAGTRVQTYEKSTFAEVLTKLTQAVGIASTRADFGAMQNYRHDYLLQHGNDLAFIDQMVQRANCVWWVEGSTFVVADATKTKGSVSLSMLKTMTDFSVRASGLRPLSAKTSGWDLGTLADVVGQSAPAPSTPTSNFASPYIGNGPRSMLGREPVVTAADGHPNVAAEATALANSVANAWHAGAVVARGTTLVNSRIVPMLELEVTDAGPSSGKYTVTRVEHVFRKEGFVTKFVAGPLRPSGLVDTLGKDGPDPGFGLSLLTTGVVSDTKDPDKLGRVKVKYNGIGTDQFATNWARVVSLGGGAARGSFFLPEINDEVLLGFERGDSRRPVVIGGLFSKQNAIAGDDKATAQNGTIAYRRITSRLGHVIELADGQQPAEQHVLLKLANGHSLRLGADEMKIHLDSQKPFTLEAGRAKIAIDASGNISIEGASISLSATQQNIDLKAAAGQLTMKGQSGVTLGGATVAIKGDAQASIEAGGPMAVKGAIVMIN